MKKILTYTALLLVSGVVFSACLPKQNQEAAMEETNEVMVKDDAMEADGDVMVKLDDEAMDGEDEKMDGDEAMMEKADVEVSMEMGMFYYTPNVIEASPGDTVTVTIENVEGLHDFVIDELDVATEQVNAGETLTATFTIPEDASGEEYEFYCSVMNHREKGMFGTLMVK